jgi:hypothetical protein
LVNKVEPVLRNFLEKIVVLIPENIKKIIIGPGSHEAEEFVIKNIAKVAAKGTASYEATSYLIKKFHTENDKWLAQYQAKLALSVPTSGLTPVPVQSTSVKINNPPQPFNTNLLAAPGR